MRKKCWLQKLDCFFLCVSFFDCARLATTVSLSMKWYVKGKKMMVFQLKKRGCTCIFDIRLHLSSEQQKARSRHNRERIHPPMTWYLQAVDYCLLSTASPPSASDSVSHLFSATAISHGLDTRGLLQRNPFNRLTVIKETSLPSNKISNFQLPGTPSS